MSEQNKAIVRRTYEIFSKGNLETLDQVIAANAVDHDAAPGQTPGLEGTKQWFGMLRAAFPDLSITAEDVIAEGDKVVVRALVRGTHKGEFMGMPPTGKKITQAGIDIVRIVNGKVVERWGQFDNLGLMQQLGMIPAQG